MKKIILLTAAVFTIGFVNAQDGSFKLGAHLGLPLGDIKDFSSLNLGADVAYTWNLAESFDAGIATGYTSYLGKDGADAVGFVPIAATGQYNLAENWFLGADLGYGVYVGKGSGDGGFYYQPKVGYKVNKVEVYLGYKGISVSGGTFSSLNLGVNFKL
jgi:hypothetical protein